MLIDKNYFRLEDFGRGSDRPEFWEESWRPEKTCCHSGSCERHEDDPAVKKLNNNNNKGTEIIKK